MLGRLATGLVAVLTLGRRTDSLTGSTKVIDGDTIVVAGQLVRLHGIDAPELDQPFWWRGQKLLCGTMALPPSRPSRPASVDAGVMRETDGSGSGVAALAKAIERVHYEGLDLSHLELAGV